MEIGMWCALRASAAESTLAQVNGRLAVGGLSITREDARMLAERRSEALAETERVEFGTPAIVEVAGALAGSPCLVQQNVADALAVLQDAFYAIRDELPANVSDAEITDKALALWRDVVATMPPIRNVALRDTLASLGELRRRYDVHFAAHEVPCDIDYQLNVPVGPGLLGIDYVETYLAKLLAEARWIAQFDVKSCVAVLERTCPDYQGLHVNLCDLLLPHEGELTLADEPTEHRRKTTLR